MQAGRKASGQAELVGMNTVEMFTAAAAALAAESSDGLN